MVVVATNGAQFYWESVAKSSSWLYMKLTSSSHVRLAFLFLSPCPVLSSLSCLSVCACFLDGHVLPGHLATSPWPRAPGLLLMCRKADLSCSSFSAGPW